MSSTPINDASTTGNATANAPLTAEQIKLVENHRALAASIARGFTGRGIDADDLASIADLALVRAARNFSADNAGQAPFAPYGASWVRHCIIHELHAMVCDRAACPSSQQKLLSTARRAARSFALKHGREPHAAEFAKELNISTDRAASLLVLLHSHKSSINDTPTGDPDAKSIDIPQRKQEKPLDALTSRENKKLLSRALQELPPQQAEAVARRFGLGVAGGGGRAVQSVQEVAAGLGVSVGQAQQLIRNALTALGTSLKVMVA